MAITINGSGTITGISTGGLPDGIVDDGTLATSAVTSIKIADGAIAVADIADDAVTEAKLANAINTAISANTAKVTNATHTGDVTGATALTIADNAVTLAKMAGGTDGELITYDTLGDPAKVAVGTSGHVLTSGGAGVAPTFQAAAAGGITEADQWRLTTDKGCNTGVQYITANWERVDTDGFGKLGTGISESSGIFSFPSTGVWLVTFQAGTNKVNDAARYVQNQIYTTVNNSTYDIAVTAWSSIWNSGYTTYTTSQSSFIFDVTSTTTHKLKTAISPAAYVVCDGDSGQNVTCLTFIKLGDT